MLNDLQLQMNNVRVSAPTYQDLVSLYYLKKMLLVEKEFSIKENFLIFKNFCEIYKNINSNEDVKIFMNKVNKFRKDLKKNGIRVEDLKDKKKEWKDRSIGFCIIIELLRGIFLIPFFIFFFPIKKILITISEKKRIQAVSNSVVKGNFFIKI